MKSSSRFASGLLIITFLSSAALQAQVSITPDRTDGIYHTGETASWTITREGDKTPDSVRYVLKKGSLIEVSAGPVVFADGATKISYTFEKPGTVLLEVRWGTEKSWKNRKVGGAVADPDQIVLSATKPLDFDVFWDAKLKELAAIPAKPSLEKGESGVEGVDYYKITMDNIIGSKIQGQLARPTKGKKLPALLIVQWAGVYPLEKSWAVNRAKEGWLVLNILAHDLPIDREKEFYEEKGRGALQNYPAIGNDDKETSYFLRMYLSCYRAAEYLSNRPDWNKKTLAVTGASQGGLQALMTAGFYPGITACMALVPAGFDFLGPEIGRKGGWPDWYNQTSDKNEEKVREASRYYDVANFIPKIKCPMLVGVGLLDETCPPAGILAGLNQYTGPKEIMILPASAHQNQNGSQDAYTRQLDEVWLPVLKKGKKVPIPD